MYENVLNARKIQCKAHTFCLANSAFKSTKDEKTDLHLHTQFICHDLWLKLCITHFYQISFYIIPYLKMYSPISSLVFLEFCLIIDYSFLQCFWNWNKNIISLACKSKYEINLFLINTNFLDTENFAFDSMKFCINFIYCSFNSILNAFYRRDNSNSLQLFKDKE